MYRGVDRIQTGQKRTTRVKKIQKKCCRCQDQDIEVRNLHKNKKGSAGIANLFTNIGQAIGNLIGGGVDEYEEVNGCMPCPTGTNRRSLHHDFVNYPKQRERLPCDAPPELEAIETVEPIMAPPEETTCLYDNKQWPPRMSFYA